jgi:hypothetical protein
MQGNTDLAEGAVARGEGDDAEENIAGNASHPAGKALSMRCESIWDRG